MNTYNEKASLILGITKIIASIVVAVVIGVVVNYSEANSKANNNVAYSYSEIHN